MTTQLRTIWMRHPNQRLGQLLVNAIGEQNLFYIEDGELIERLKEGERKWSTQSGEATR